MRTVPMTASLVIATLMAVTKEARTALGGKGEVAITRFPFKVGRESRVAKGSPDTVLRELRLGVAPQVNDVYLIEPPDAGLLHISREHFSIELVGEEFFALDRGSACGTIVAGIRLGGNLQGGRTRLRHGDQIKVGTEESPYIFQFELMFSKVDRQMR